MKSGPLMLMTVSILLLGACIHRSPSTGKAMTFENCSEGPVCVITGRLSVELVDHVKMGRLVLQDGSCVNVSLPPSSVRKAEEYPARMQTISGKVKHGEFDENTVSLIVKGRRVGLSQCGTFYVFVD